MKNKVKNEVIKQTIIWIYYEDGYVLKLSQFSLNNVHKVGSDPQLSHDLCDHMTYRYTLHTEARFVPDSPLPKLLFWLQFTPLRQFLKTYKNAPVHVSL